MMHQIDDMATPNIWPDTNLIGKEVDCMCNILIGVIDKALKE